MEYMTLNNGIRMPQLGFGVWKVPDEEATDAVATALEDGYRLIDTAKVYGNERGVGEALAKSNVPREELFITTKVWNADQGYDNTLQAFDASLDKLGLDYIDLYLIHWPTPVYDTYIDTYKALEKLYADGRVRAIGVCNFHAHHLERVMKECDVTPAVNQVECHPYLQQDELKDYCRKQGIILESYSPLMNGKDVLQDEMLQAIAEKYDKTVAQIILRWHLDSGAAVIPKSVTPERIKENIDVFDFVLEKEDMDTIAALDRNERSNQDPETMNVQ